MARKKNSSKISTSSIGNTLSVQLDLNYPTGNFWIDNGLVYLVNHFGRGVYSSEDILDHIKKHNTNNGDWISPVKYFIKVKPQKLKLKLTKTKNYCHFCGRENQVTEIKMWMFPFVVTQDKFSNFYSQVKGKLPMYY